MARKKSNPIPKVNLMGITNIAINGFSRYDNIMVDGKLTPVNVTSRYIFPDNLLRGKVYGMSYAAVSRKGVLESIVRYTLSTSAPTYGHALTILSRAEYRKRFDSRFLRGNIERLPGLRAPHIELMDLLCSDIRARQAFSRISVVFLPDIVEMCEEYVNQFSEMNPLDKQNLLTNYIKACCSVAQVCRLPFVVTNPSVMGYNDLVVLGEIDEHVDQENIYKDVETGATIKQTMGENPDDVYAPTSEEVDACDPDADENVIFEKSDLIGTIDPGEHKNGLAANVTATFRYKAREDVTKDILLEKFNTDDISKIKLGQLVEEKLAFYIEPKTAMLYAMDYARYPNNIIVASRDEVGESIECNSWFEFTRGMRLVHDGKVVGVATNDFTEKDLNRVNEIVAHSHLSLITVMESLGFILLFNDEVSADQTADFYTYKPSKDGDDKVEPFAQLEKLLENKGVENGNY